VPASGQPSLCTSTHAGTAGRLDTARSRKVPATITVCRRHHQTLFFLPGIISLFIMCVEIIWNNSLVGRRAQAEVWTLATERATLYCTWRRVLRPIHLCLTLWAYEFAYYYYGMMLQSICAKFWSFWRWCTGLEQVKEIS